MILPVISQSFSSNTYILVDKRTAIIDPGISLNAILKKFNDEKIKPDLIILTHCHYDHVASAQKIKERTNARILAHEICADVFENFNGDLMLSKLFNSYSTEIKVDEKLKDGDKIKLGTSKLEVLHTPGHTQDSICLYDKKTRSLFSGDTIFAYGIGRTDIPTGDFSLLRKSIEKLLKLKEEQGIKEIYPGHGPIVEGDDIKQIYHYYFH